MKFVNLTGKALRFAGKDGWTTTKPSGSAPRVEGGAVVGLPAPAAGTAYVVTAEIAEALPEREDLYVPCGERFDRVEPGRLCSGATFVGFAGLTRDSGTRAAAGDGRRTAFAAVGGSRARKARAAKRG